MAFAAEAGLDVEAMKDRILLEWLNVAWPAGSA
jgi:hypothetical protein